MLFVLAVRREKPANNLYGFLLVGKLICGGIGVDMFLCEHSEPLYPISYILYPSPIPCACLLTFYFSFFFVPLLFLLYYIFVFVCWVIFLYLYTSPVTCTFLFFIKMQEVGFEPTPPKRPVPETGALDHSATLASTLFDLKNYTTMAGFEPTPP